MSYMEPTKRLKSFVVAIFMFGVALGLIVSQVVDIWIEPPAQCPTEDSCDLIYDRDREMWHVVEIEP